MEGSGPAILGLFEFFVSIIIIIVFLVLANNVSKLREEAQNQTRFLEAISVNLAKLANHTLSGKS